MQALAARSFVRGLEIRLIALEQEVPWQGKIVKGNLLVCYGTQSRIFIDV
jgi:hypothetical protein